MIRKNGLHLYLRLPVPRIHIVELLLSRSPRIHLVHPVKRLRQMHQRPMPREEEPQRIPPAVFQRRAAFCIALRRLMFPFPHQSLIHSHQRPEIEVLPHTARLIIIDRIVLPPAIRRPQPVVTVHHRRPGPSSLLQQPSAGLPGIIHFPLRSYPQQHISIVSFDYFHIISD